ncbi:MAG: UDP-N-acetylmuramoyl-tripeptide--D-alanyl-D-alanine ligase [Clostridia bacterium]|nr:UDP-N-acetylmuramoyl-tripeptide--D-alanyl-D-alanine ligase [Clostridia bacterium]
MIDMTVKEALLACDGEFYGDESVLSKNISGAVIDSRKACDGSLFIAIKGTKTDGYDYIPAACEKGAVCAVTQRPYEGYPCIVTDDVCAALGSIARAYRQKLNITVVGITGSVGKTTTKELVASVLSQKYIVTKTEGNFNNDLGLPLTILSIQPDTEIAVVEMGMNHFDEMRYLSSIARPTMCIMTNIGVSHIENLGSRENIYKAKSEIFEHMPPAARCVLNGDDDLLRQSNRYNKCFYGFDEDNDVYIESFQEKGFDGTSFSVSLFGEHFDCHIGIPGKHMLYASMAALAAGSWLGLTHDQLVEGIASAKAISGRVNVIKTDKYTVIDDCYNAAPSSVESGIDILTKCEGKRKVCILGDMFELGSEGPMLHKHVGEHAAKCRIGLLIAIGELSKNTYNGMVQNGGKALYYATKEEFLKDKENVIEDGDVVLIKASHGMEFGKIVEEF